MSDNIKNIGLPAMPKEFKIDFDKVKSKKDIIEILKAMDVSFWVKSFDERFLPIKHLLRKVEK